MTNDARRALEDAVISYGTAKALHATSEPRFREVAMNAVCETWDRMMNILDEMERLDAPRGP